MTGLKKKKIGTVLSNKMQKTVIVEVARRIRHPLFQKFFVKRKKFKVHDEKGECGIGDTVLIQECRPISREKRWKVKQVLEKGAVA
ncbi:MAG: 30S ribosomal protein S17 [Deltaproteobacteria bacterium]|nr:30S ribosomal protein S17 [Deltaproteobacteria bacterium]